MNLTGSVFSSQNALIPQKRNILHSLCPQVALALLYQDHAWQLGSPQRSCTPPQDPRAFLPPVSPHLK